MKQRDNVRSGCTFLLPSGTTGYQHFYHCNECYGDKSIKVCGFCIETCHKGHRRNHSSSLSSSSSQEKTKQTGKCGCGELGCITNAYVDSSDLSDSFLVFVYSDMEQDPQKPFQYPLGIDQEKIFFFRRASTIFRQADQGRGYLTPKLFREGLSKFEHLLPNYGSLDTSHAAFTSTVSNDKVKNPLDLLFKAIDKTGSGKITEREFAEFYVFEKIRTLDSTVNRCPLQYAIEKGLFQEQLSLEQSQVEDSKVGGSDSVGSRESVHGDDGSVNRTGVKGVVGVGRIGRAKGSVSKTDRDRNVGGGGDRENLHGEKENTSPQTWKKITPGKSRQVSEVLDSCRKMLEELKSFNPSDLVFGMSNLEATESVLSKTLESIKLEKIKPTLSTTINWIGFFVSNGVKYNVETTMCWKNGIIDGPQQNDSRGTYTWRGSYDCLGRTQFQKIYFEGNTINMEGKLDKFSISGEWKVEQLGVSGTFFLSCENQIQKERGLVVKTRRVEFGRSSGEDEDEPEMECPRVSFANIRRMKSVIFDGEVHNQVTNQLHHRSFEIMMVSGVAIGHGIEDSDDYSLSGCYDEDGNLVLAKCFYKKSRKVILIDAMRTDPVPHVLRLEGKIVSSSQSDSVSLSESTFLFSKDSFTYSGTWDSNLESHQGTFNFTCVKGASNLTSLQKGDVASLMSKVPPDFPKAPERPQLPKCLLSQGEYDVYLRQRKEWNEWVSKLWQYLQGNV
eukprot:TRINITY_DN4351_c0_g2_i1.p1 TRINITY_DN4351_c0_g2~~TRINITY_DN4351_c0_g2_i1.p1  ORF type:complete len:728 (-),score=170.04 TRINITY_DN4351_c0_g2_i1:1110-3293(-)